MYTILPTTSCINLLGVAARYAFRKLKLREETEWKTLLASVLAHQAIKAVQCVVLTSRSYSLTTPSGDVVASPSGTVLISRSYSLTTPSGDVVASPSGTVLISRSYSLTTPSGDVVASPSGTVLISRLR